MHSRKTSQKNIKKSIKGESKMEKQAFKKQLNSLTSLTKMAQESAKRIESAIKGKDSEYDFSAERTLHSAINSATSTVRAQTQGFKILTR
jgi:hypothetical protein